MNIGIIGYGNVGSALASGWHKSGHKVAIGAINPVNEKVKELIASHPGMESGLIPDVAERSEVIVFAVPAGATQSVCAQLTGKIQDQIIIDAMNCISSYPDPYTSTFEALEAWTGSSRIIKCFNTTGAANILKPGYPEGLFADMFMAGDDIQAKEITRGLALELGFANCFDVGTSKEVHHVENLAKFWINLAFKGMGPNFVLKLITR